MNVFSLEFGTNVYHSSYCLESFMKEKSDLCDWKTMSLKQSLSKIMKSKNTDKSEKKYAKDTLRQVERRGKASKFVGHDKYTEKVER